MMNLTLTSLSFSGSAADFASVERFFEAQAAAGRQIIIATEDDVAAKENEERDEQEEPVAPDIEGPPEGAFLAVIQRRAQLAFLFV